MSTEVMQSSAETLCDKGRELLRGGRMDEAIVVLKKATTEDSYDEGAWRLLGEAYVNLGDSVNAAQAFQRTVVLDPLSAENRYNLSVVQQANGDHFQAKEQLERAAKLNSAYLQALEQFNAQEQVATNRTSPASAASSSVAPLPVLGVSYGTPHHEVENTSGMDSDVPGEIANKWNWGAFAFGWIWLYAHKMKGAAAGVFIAHIMLNNLGRTTSNPLPVIISLGISIALGVMGNRLGWKNRRFETVDHFRKCQRVWAGWGVGITLIVFLIFLDGFWIGYTRAHQAHM